MPQIDQKIDLQGDHRGRVGGYSDEYKHPRVHNPFVGSDIAFRTDGTRDVPLVNGRAFPRNTFVQRGVVDL